MDMDSDIDVDVEDEVGSTMCKATWQSTERERRSTISTSIEATKNLHERCETSGLETGPHELEVE